MGNTKRETRRYGLDTRMPFGKYKHVEVWEIIRDDPEYITWLIESVDNFELDNDAYFEHQKQTT